MKAIILAGGKGTRLRPLTVYTPKPIVPLANIPFLIYQLEVLRRAGVDDVTFSLSYQPDKIEDLIGARTDLISALNFVTEPNPLGTAGAYKFALGSAKEPAVVINGDILLDIDLADAISFHREKKAAATLVLATVDDPSKYGLVETDKEGRILGFLEKPDGVLPDGPKSINAGIYILEPQIAETIADGESVSFEYSVFPHLLETGVSVFGYTLKDAYWRDIGNPQSYLQANLDVLDGLVHLPSLQRSQRDSSQISATAFVDEKSAVDLDVVVKSNSSVTRSAIGAGVQIEERSNIRDSVIWPYTRIGGGVEIEGAMVGRGCHIGKNVVIRNGTVLGDKAVIPDYSVV